MNGQRQGLGRDFTASWLAVQRLRDLAASRPEEVEPETVRVLGDMLAADLHAARPQAGFLYRDAAGLLAGLTAWDRPLPGAAPAASVLRQTLALAGRPRLAAAEALGVLPLAIRGPAPPSPPAVEPPRLDWTELLLRLLGRRDVTVVQAGRSLIVSGFDCRRLLAVKFLRAGEEPAGLRTEAAWMAYFQDQPPFPERFEPPRPALVGGSPLYRLDRAPVRLAAPHPEGLGMGFFCHPDYFNYPNETPTGQDFDPETFLEVLGRNAALLGRLTAMGLAHTAAIPLFHNRVQRERRDDAGLYDWRRMGRLDRWLHSSRFPNLGASGPRDFEHLVSFSGGPEELRRLIGDHVLGLCLVAGSAFRLRRPELVGLGPDGEPADARFLFEPELLERALADIFRGYYAGFAGEPHAGPVPFDLAGLVPPLVEAMGVDRHMHELLRTADQQAMDDAAFAAFLAGRGLSPGDIAGLRRGEADVPLPTGPHLGEFNGRISVPELLEFVAVTAAACVSGRFFRTAGPRDRGMARGVAA